MNSFELNLFLRFMRDLPFQPATQFWRAIEISKVIKHGLPNGRGLDLGCGDGRLMQVILENIGYREIDGIDLDVSETDLAKKIGCYKQVYATPADDIPFENETFDFVFSNSVLEHIDRIDNVLSEVVRVLRKDGQFVFTVPGDMFHSCLKNGKATNKYLDEIDRRCQHVRYWGGEEWIVFLNQYGFSDIEVKGYLNKGEVRRWEVISNMTSGLLYKLFLKKSYPIEIQRKMNLRKWRVKLPEFVFKFIGYLLSYGLKSDCHDEVFGCLLVRCKK